MPKVYNRKHGFSVGVYVGRPTKWGNPFHLGTHGNRQNVIKLFRERVCSNPQMIEEIRRELRGQDLICWCSPLPCHADVLLEIANSTGEILSCLQ